MSQLPLNLPHDISFAAEDFLVTQANKTAWQAMLLWPDGTVHAAVLVGASGSGKSHLAHMWAERVSAKLYTPTTPLEHFVRGDAVLVEDIDRTDYAPDMLFHLYNWMKELGGCVLFTSRKAPADLTVSLADLRSRLKAAALFAIDTPDDDLLTLVLMKQFADRQLQVDADVIQYLVKRMERSFKAATEIASKLDQAALSEKRAITLPFARKCGLVDELASGV